MFCEMKEREQYTYRNFSLRKRAIGFRAKFLSSGLKTFKHMKQKLQVVLNVFVYFTGPPLSSFQCCRTWTEPIWYGVNAVYKLTDDEKPGLLN